MEAGICASRLLEASKLVHQHVIQHPHPQLTTDQQQHCDHSEPEFTEAFGRWGQTTS